MKKIPFEWEELEGAKKEVTQRAKVIGGWVLNHFTLLTHEGGNGISESTVFIPDPDHEWEVE